MTEGDHVGIWGGEKGGTSARFPCLERCRGCSLFTQKAGETNTGIFIERLQYRLYQLI